MSSSYLDCVWYRHPQRAAGKALEISSKSAESMFVVKDKESNMFGVGVGDSAPPWCTEESNMEMVCVINPTKH